MSLWKAITGLINDTTYRTARVDASTHSLQVVDYAHHEIHSGSAYVVSYNADVSSGANLDVLIVTPNTTAWAHMLLNLAGENELLATLYETATVSAAGTALTEVNHNRNSANTAAVVVTHTPTVTGTGTAIWQRIGGSGETVGGEARNDAEMILKQNTTYLLRLTNNGVGTGWINVELDWYEHTDKN